MITPKTAPSLPQRAASPPPSRPPMRQAPQPFNFNSIDNSVSLYRGAASILGPTLGAAAVGIFYPSELGSGTMENYTPEINPPTREPSYRGWLAGGLPQEQVSPSIENIDVRANGTNFNALINPNPDPWHPVVVGSDLVRGFYGNPADLEYYPNTEEAYAGVLSEKMPIIRDLPETVAVPVSRWMHLSVASTLDGPIVRGRLATAPERVLSRPRYKDNKYGKSLVAAINRAITATWGVVSEMGDTVSALVHNTYGLHNGRVVPAMMLEGGSTINVIKGMLEGDYRTDTVGFTIDFAIMQTSDVAYALQARALQRMERELGFNLPISQASIMKAANGGERVNHVLSSDPILSSQQWLRSQDVKRASRVSALF